MKKENAVSKSVAIHAAKIPAYLLSSRGCERRLGNICYGGHHEAIKCNPENDRWYITMGHPGFNSVANNGIGYDSPRAAYREINSSGRGQKRKEGFYWL